VSARLGQKLIVPKIEKYFCSSRQKIERRLISKSQATQTLKLKENKNMIRTIALSTLFAIALFALPTKTTNVLPTPTCNPCTNPWT
jgi:hypothetical protein